MKVLAYTVMMMMTQMFGPGDDKEPGDGEYVHYKQGMVVNMGGKGPSACGWAIEIEGRKYKPKNLSKAFQKDSVKVNVDFDYSLTLFKCDMVKTGLQEIHINWMERIK